MADVFVSYARNDKARVAPVVAAIEAKGWSVWWDPDITPGQEFDDQIEAEITAALAVLVVWTPTSVTSRWVRGEAREAAERGVLVPVRFDQARLPMDVRAIHTTDLDGWGENAASPQAQEFLRALGTHIARSQASRPAKPGSASASSTSGKDSPRYTICVLPFVNMSGDPEQEYFSDGITEDIITDLSKVSALGIIARNSAFMYKEKNVDILKVARELKVSHVLEGSVRKAGGRIRINAQLVDGADQQPRLGRSLRPRFQRHLRAAGRDFRGDRQGAETAPAAGGEKGDRAARHQQCRSPQSLPDGAPDLHHQPGVRDPFRGGHRSTREARHGNRSGLRASLGADGHRARQVAAREGRRFGRRHGGGGTRARPGPRSRRGPRSQGPDPAAGRRRRSRGGGSRHRA